MNRGAMPQDMFLNQIHRFGKEVLPRLQAHKITRVPLAEAVAESRLVHELHITGSRYIVAAEFARHARETRLVRMNLNNVCGPDRK